MARNHLALIHVVLIGGMTLTSSCGPASSAGGTSDFQRTLAYLASNGLPSFASLFPSLPTSFVQIEGVNTDATGLPSQPTNLDGSVLSTGSPDLSNLLVEAKVLSGQGFSEARRLEALVQGLIQPVFQVTGQKSLFQAVGLAGAGFNDEGQPNLSYGEDSPLADSSLSSENSIATLFEELNVLDSFVVELSPSAGVPSHIVFAKVQSDDLVHVTGIWPDAKGGGYNAGFDIAFKILGADEFQFKFALAPNISGTTVGNWTNGSCADDVWEVSLAKLADKTEAAVTSIECASANNRVSALSISRDGTAFNIGSTFAQNFSDAKSGSIRDFLGKRQGFVLQASASSDLSEVAAAAAVLKETDFKTGGQAAVDRFGVGQLLVDFVLAKYWEPKKSSISGGFFPSASDLTNVAYYACESALSSSIKSAVSGTSELCSGTQVSAESLVQTMIGLKTKLDGLPVSDSVKSDAKSIVDILTIRNSIFLKTNQAVQYKEAPSDTLRSLETSRMNASLPGLDSRDWSEGARSLLRPISMSQLQKSSFTANPSKLASFLNLQCNSILSAAQDKAAKQKSDCK